LVEHADVNPEPRNDTVDSSTPRRAYTTPELIEYGTVAKLTQAGGQTVQDFFAWRRMGMGMCL
jgi:hypothetical protein